MVKEYDRRTFRKLFRIEHHYIAYTTTLTSFMWFLWGQGHVWRKMPTVAANAAISNIPSYIQCFHRCLYIFRHKWPGKDWNHNTLIDCRKKNAISNVAWFTAFIRDLSWSCHEQMWQQQRRQRQFCVCGLPFPFLGLRMLFFYMHVHSTIFTLFVNVLSFHALLFIMR